MMKSTEIHNFTYNKVIIAGAVATAPVFKEVTQDHCICFFEVMTTSARGKREYTNTHRVVCYGKMARSIHSSVHVGDVIFVEGELIYRELPGNTGTVRQFAEINAFSSRLLLSAPELEDVSKKRHSSLDYEMFEDEF